MLKYYALHAFEKVLKKLLNNLNIYGNLINGNMLSDFFSFYTNNHMQIYIYIYSSLSLSIYIYIYTLALSFSLSLSLSLYIYIYTSSTSRNSKEYIHNNRINIHNDMHNKDMHYNMHFINMHNKIHDNMHNEFLL